MKKLISAVTVLVLIGGAVVAASPALRNMFFQKYNEVTGWTKEAREADPAGYIDYAEDRMEDELEELETTRRGLAGQVGTLNKKLRDVAALALQAREMAGEFRTEYQAAMAADQFPIELHGQAYTEIQVHQQVSQLLAQAENHETSLVSLQAVQADAEAKMEELTVRIDKTEAELATLPTKRELLKARKLTSEGEQLLAHVDLLMSGNADAIEGTPVRSVEELIAAKAQVKPAASESEQRVDTFLAIVEEVTETEIVEPVTFLEEGEEINEVDVVDEVEEAQEVQKVDEVEQIDEVEHIDEVEQIDEVEAKPVAPQKKASQKRKNKKAKPIFQQS